jgi:serine/threonine protein phosphatase 1
MRLFAVGDIHGCATALTTLLAAIDPRPGDCIVTLGDYINKGPDSKAVLDSLVRLSREGMLVPLLGNHELKFLIARRLGRAVVNGEILVDRQTLTSYRARGKG